jgi:hypothetical protein
MAFLASSTGLKSLGAPGGRACRPFRCCCCGAATACDCDGAACRCGTACCEGNLKGGGGFEPEGWKRRFGAGVLMKPPGSGLCGVCWFMKDILVLPTALESYGGGIDEEVGIGEGFVSTKNRRDA